MNNISEFAQIAAIFYFILHLDLDAYIVPLNSEKLRIYTDEKYLATITSYLKKIEPFGVGRICFSASLKQTWAEVDFIYHEH